MIRLIDERVMEKLRDKPENIDLEEFMPLVGEWREEKVSKAKCPYCVKPIEKQATKCTHCLSDIVWGNHPCPCSDIRTLALRFLPNVVVDENEYNYCWELASGGKIQRLVI